MIEYGTAFLAQLLKYYSDRMQEAKKRGYDIPETKYHWLYRELDHRVETIQMVQGFLKLLPQYLRSSDAERTLALAVQYTEIWFMEKAVGPLPHDEQGNCTYFCDENVYWNDVQAAADYIGNELDQSDQLLCQRCISDYVIRCLRLYLFLREQQFKAIDRGKFHELMGPVKTRGCLK